MDSLNRLLAVSFPGGYRVLAVNLVAYLATIEASDFFARAFFMISVLSAFSAFPVSTQAYVVSRRITLLSALFATLVLLAIKAVPGYLLWGGSDEGYLAVCLAAIGYCLFELIRSRLAAEGQFRKMVIAGVIAVLALGPIVYMGAASGQVLVISVFSSLALSALLVAKISWRSGIGLNHESLRDIGSYSLSSGVSTGLTFLFPLLLAPEYGAGGATLVAQVFTLSMVMFFYPKFLSAKFMVDFRRDQSWASVRVFERQTIMYALVVCSGCVVVNELLFDYSLSIVLLFIAIQLTQVGLPYANTHTLLGGGAEMLRVNVIAMMSFLFVMGLVVVAMDEGSYRGDVMVSIYFLYVVFRNYLTRKSCRKLLAGHTLFVEQVKM